MLAPILEAIGTIVWVALGLSSIAVFACLLAVLSRSQSFPKRLPRRIRTGIQILRDPSVNPEDRAVLREQLLDDMKRIRWLRPSASAAGDLIAFGLEAGLVKQQSGSARSLLEVLKLAPPSLGLTGTMCGVSMTLGSFAANPGDPGRMFEGISYALYTTLAGMLISLVALGVDKLVVRKTKTLSEELTQLGIALRLTGNDASKPELNGDADHEHETEETVMRSPQWQTGDQSEDRQPNGSRISHHGEARPRVDELRVRNNGRRRRGHCNSCVEVDGVPACDDISEIDRKISRTKQKPNRERENGTARNLNMIAASAAKPDPQHSHATGSGMLHARQSQSVDGDHRNEIIDSLMRDDSSNGNSESFSEVEPRPSPEMSRPVAEALTAPAELNGDVPLQDREFTSPIDCASKSRGLSINTSLPSSTFAAERESHV